MAEYCGLPVVTWTKHEVPFSKAIIIPLLLVFRNIQTKVVFRKKGD
jgi:hypothetical protein